MANVLVSPITVHLADTPPPIISPEAREISFTASNEIYFDRYDWFKGEKYQLSFSHSPSAVDLSRVTSRQCMFLEGHSYNGEGEILGIVTDAKLQNGSLITTHRIGGNEDAVEYWSDVVAGVVPGVSIEALVTELKVIQPAVYETPDDSQDRYVKRTLITPAKLQATKWKLLAVASVAIPAIDGACQYDEQEYMSATKIPVMCSGVTGYEWVERSTKMTLENTQNTMGSQMGIESTVETLEVSSDEPNKLVQLSNQVRELNREKLELQGKFDKLTAQTADLTLRCRYWQLRHDTQGAYAIHNQMTLEEFQQDFTEDPESDIQRLSAMGDESVIELKIIERQLNQASKRTPIERLHNQSEIALLSNRSINSKAALDVSGERTQDEDSDNTLVISASAVNKFLEKVKPREIGKTSRR
jgi:hypothetical protein